MRGLYWGFQFALYLCAFVLGVTVQFSARRWPPNEAPPPLSVTTATPPAQAKLTITENGTTAAPPTNVNPSTPPSSTFVASEKPREPFSCRDWPASCGFVMIHVCLGASYCPVLSAASSPVQAEEGWWSAVLSATRLRQLIHDESPIVLLTNYASSHVEALRRLYESRGPLPGLEAKDVIEFAGGGAQFFDEDYLTAGQGYPHATNFEGAWPESTPTIAAGVAFMQTHETPEWLHPDDERSVSGLRLLQQQRSWPFSHVISLRDDSNDADGDDETPIGDAKRSNARVQIKPDFLVCLMRNRGAKDRGSGGDDVSRASVARGCVGSTEADSASLLRLRSQVERWLFLDSDTLVQNVSIRDWRFKDDDAAALSDEALRRQVDGTWRHLDAVFLRHVVAESNPSAGASAVADPQATWSERRAESRRHHHHHVLYDAMDLLAWDHLVLVPELNSQRDLGPFLYHDLLREPIGPEGLIPNSNELLPYRLYQYVYPFERQFNTGFIGFQGTSGVVLDLFQLWSKTHRSTPRCRNDTVAWDQCSLPRVLRLANNLRVSSTWEAFNARDALGAGCSSILYSNGVRDLKMNREHMVVIHRRRVKAFLRRLMRSAWGENFTTHHFFNVSAWAASPPTQES